MACSDEGLSSPAQMIERVEEIIREDDPNRFPQARTLCLLAIERLQGLPRFAKEGADYHAALGRVHYLKGRVCQGLGYDASGDFEKAVRALETAASVTEDGAIAEVYSVHPESRNPEAVWAFLNPAVLHAEALLSLGLCAKVGHQMMHLENAAERINSLLEYQFIQGELRAQLEDTLGNCAYAVHTLNSGGRLTYNRPDLPMNRAKRLIGRCFYGRA